MREKHKFPLHFSFPIYQRTKPGFFTGKCVPFLKALLKSIHSQFYSGNQFRFKKSGFGIPLDKYINTETKNEIYELLMNRNGVVLDLIEKII